MKKILFSILLLSLLLASCSNINAGDQSASTTAPSDAFDDAAQVQIDYYQAQNKALQEEILSLKTMLYTQKVEYEAIIAELTKPQEEDEQVFAYTVKEGIAIVTGYRGKATDVVIPESLGGYPVKSIGDSAFLDRVNIVSVTLPQSVTSIGWFAFSGCVSLTGITIPSTVTSIGYDAFVNCSASLTFITPADSYAHSYAVSYGIRVK